MGVGGNLSLIKKIRAATTGLARKQKHYALPEKLQSIFVCTTAALCVTSRCELQDIHSKLTASGLCEFLRWRSIQLCIELIELN